MKFKGYALAFLTIVVASCVRAQSSDSTANFKGLNLSNSEESLLIPVKEKVSIKTNTSKFKGIIDSVHQDQLYIEGNAISKSEIEIIKFIPAEKRMRRNAFLWSAPASLAGAIGFGFWYLGSGGTWTNIIATALLIYTPVGLITGVILSQKQIFKMDEWELKIIE